MGSLSRVFLFAPLDGAAFMSPWHGHGCIWFPPVISTFGRNPTRPVTHTYPTILPDAAWLDISSQSSVEMTANATQEQAAGCRFYTPPPHPQRCYGLTYVTHPGLMGCSLKNNPYASRRGSVRIAHGIAVGILRLRLSLSHGCAVGGLSVISGFVFGSA